MKKLLLELKMKSQPPPVKPEPTIPVPLKVVDQPKPPQAEAELPQRESKPLDMTGILSRPAKPLGEKMEPTEQPKSVPSWQGGASLSSLSLGEYISIDGFVVVFLRNLATANIVALYFFKILFKPRFAVFSVVVLVDFLLVYHLLA